MSYEDDIRPEYIPNPPDHQAVTLADLAETVTSETLPDFLMKLVDKSQQGGAYRDLILAIAAKTLNRPICELWSEQEKYERPIARKFQVVNASDWLNSEPPPPDQIIEGLFDKGDKFGIIGGSKQRKSFFFIQMMMCIATGRDFLGYRVPKKRRVLMIQFEIQRNHYHRRIEKMAKALGISEEELGNNLLIINARGLGVTAADVTGEICRIALENRVEIVAFDPLYKLMYDGENAPSDFRLIFSAFDHLAEKAEAAVAYVHHDPKGEAGDRNLQDRGAGSNILSRDYDACFALSAHGSGDDKVAVVEVLLRNYPPRDGICIEWNGQCFIPRTDLPATKRTSGNKKNADKLPLSSYEPQAIELVKDKPLKISIFKDVLKKNCTLTVDRTKAVVDLVTGNGTLAIHRIRGRGINECWIGLPPAIEEMKRK